MKPTLSLLVLLLVLFASAGLLYAADAQETTLKGKLLCAHCALSEGDKCQSVLVVKDGDAEQKYYLADSPAAKGSHKAVCMAPREGVTVTGTVQEKDGKKWLTASKVEGLETKKE